MSESPRNGPRPPAPPPGGPKKGAFARNPFLLILLVLTGVVVLQSLWNTKSGTQLTYDELKAMARNMEARSDLLTNPEARAAEPLDPKRDQVPGIYEITIQPAAIAGWFRPSKDELKRREDWRQAVAKDGKYKDMVPFVMDRVVADEELLKLLESKGVKIKPDNPTDWAAAMFWVIPLLFLFFLLMMFRSSRMSGENVISFGRSRAKIVSEDKTGVTFKNVAGANEAKEELVEIVEFLKEPERFTKLGGKIPKGVLLMGPPGCGKTLLARAVAGEAGVPFFTISGSDFVEMFVGVGAARVRDLFNTAKQRSPCIIFVDEIDAVGRHRGTGLGGGHDEREQTLNQLLVEMDGFDGRKGVIVIAATNRPDILDPALLRPGRFDRQVVLDAPDLMGREAILTIHATDKPLAEDVDLKMIARRTPGFSGADLANVMNEAALLAARRERNNLSMTELTEAVERVVAGPERRSRIINDREKRILAYHELGHALVARYSEGADPVHKVSIIPRGRGALGYTLTLPEEDRYIITRKELLARIRVMLGGRSAEEVVFDHKSTGAEDDLQKATQMARSMVCRWGMSDEMGTVAYDRSPGSPFLGREMTGQPESHSENTSSQIDNVIRQILDNCHREARDILSTNRALLDRLAEHLIEREILDFEDFEQAVQDLAEIPPPPLRRDLVEHAKGVTKPPPAAPPEAE